MIVRREQFARKIAKVTGFTIKDSLEFIRGFETALKNCAAEGDDVMLSGTMHMEIYNIKETRRKHPETGEFTVLPPHSIIKIRAGADLKRQIKEC